jgi:outer membrane protein OmpA-like peptidoglycan-associated protein
MRSTVVLGLAAMVGASVLGLGCHHRTRVVVREQEVVVEAPAGLTGVILVGAQIDIRGDIEFDTGAATIRDSMASQAVLSSVLTILQNNPSITRVRVEGHTDSDGSDASNLVLSQLRAAAVVKWLVDHGVALGRLNSVGCGASDPLVPNVSPENKQRNRRTEFDLEELGGRRPDGYTNPCAPNPMRRP